MGIDLRAGIDNVNLGDNKMGGSLGKCSSKKGGCMNKVYCLLLCGATAFSFFAFVADWVDVNKNKEENRVEFYINTGKIGSDISGCYNSVKEMFE